MDLEETLEKVVELGREEPRIVRNCAEEKARRVTTAKDSREAMTAADRLDD